MATIVLAKLGNQALDIIYGKEWREEYLKRKEQERKLLLKVIEKHKDLIRELLEEGG